MVEGVVTPQSCFGDVLVFFSVTFLTILDRNLLSFSHDYAADNVFFLLK